MKSGKVTRKHLVKKKNRKLLGQREDRMKIL